MERFLKKQPKIALKTQTMWAETLKSKAPTAVDFRPSHASSDKHGLVCGMQPGCFTARQFRTDQVAEIPVGYFFNIACKFCKSSI